MIRRFIRDDGKGASIVLSLVLGLVFMIGCLWWGVQDLLWSFANDRITAPIIRGQGFGPVLLGRLTRFGVALVFVHLLLGVLVYGLATMTARAAPRFSSGKTLPLVLGWFVAIACLVLLANATWYPASRFANDESWLSQKWSGLTPVLVPAALLAILVLCLLARAIANAWPRPPVMPLVAASILVAGSAIALLSRSPPVSPPTQTFASPHIVILGIDSLRDDMAGGHNDNQLTPHIDDFLSGAHRFSDTISPLARTYPALVSMLTGRHPVGTNARFNLMPRRLVHEGESLGDALRQHGYRSVYATDEVQFANLDESFGFNQLITPPIGASDFLLGAAGDLPLVNLISNSWLGAWLFPSNHGNRAAHVTYRPAQFVRMLERGLQIEQPGFLAIHLTLAHWPYSWAGMATPSTPKEYRFAYARAIAEVDRQFAEVMDVLERKGVLENAIVVLMSDHGEALGGATDTMLRKTGTGDEIWNSIWGHGTSVMSPHQYKVLLAIRPFGNARLPGAPGNRDWPVTLEDIRPTLQALATGTVPSDIDGYSLLPYLDGTRPAIDLDQRVRFTETDFSTPMIMEGKYDTSGLIQEGAMFYELVAETGWIQLRSDRLPELISKKQRAAISRDSLLAFIPSWTDNSHTCLFTERSSPLPRRLQGPPDPDTEPEAARLWDALHARFPGELAGISHVP